MGKFVFAYTGGAAPSSEAEGEKVMAAWMNWFGTLGAVVLDAGNPFSASTAIASDGSTTDAASGLGGYSILAAPDLATAASLAKGCPILEAGGTVEIYEAIDM